MERSSALKFIVGGRYQNRRGEYEVLDIRGRTLRVRYDDGEEADLDAEMQARIAQNMQLEARSVEPYAGGTSQSRNRRFFRSLGFLAIRASMLEAIVHPKAQEGFVQNYRIITGRRPAIGEDGYYVHVPSADKWGNELRVTFTATSQELDGLDFGPDVNVVSNPSSPGMSWRINNNGFWWRLLKLGFKMGSNQMVAEIRAHIPPQYRTDFDEGVRAAEA
jgi:hypothetical protein